MYDIIESILEFIYLNILFCSYLLDEKCSMPLAERYAQRYVSSLSLPLCILEYTDLKDIVSIGNVTTSIVRTTSCPNNIFHGQSLVKIQISKSVALNVIAHRDVNIYVWTKV